MSLRKLLLIKTLVVLYAGLAIGVGAAAQSASEAAWENGATFFPNEALAGFKALGGDLADGPRDARFGYAVSLLSATPSTEQRLNQAKLIFTDLADSGDDDFGLGSRFLLGRLFQIYRSPSDPDRAADQFRWLIENHPESRWGQMALTKLTMVVVYALPGIATPDERISVGDVLLEKAVTPDARRDINMILASAHFHYDLDPTGALPYLIAAEEEGHLDVGTRSDVLVRIGELLALAGRPDEAIVYYGRFVDDFYGAARRYAVEQKILALQEGRETIP